MRTACCVLATSLIACASGSRAPVGTPDGGHMQDAGRGEDAAVERDARTSADAAERPDAEVVHDAAAHDVGARADAGTSTDASVTPDAQLGPPPTTLREAAERRGLLVGTALAAMHLANDPTYAEIAAREFNYVTCENETKWQVLEPTQGTWNFGPADQIERFAAANNMKFKGHTLVWYQQTPNWVAALSPQAFRQAWQDHARTTLTHFRGKAIAWDVVNEAVDDFLGNLRSSVFLEKMGSDYIAEAFIFAHSIDPDAKLYYNDYLSEGMSLKSNAIYTLVKGLVDRGVPIHGVGFQAHSRIAGTLPAPPADITANVQRLQALGLEVVISELDIPQTNIVAANIPEQQAIEYGQLVSACLAVRACNAVTVWGIPDHLSWYGDYFNQPDARPLLFDANYQKKPAYHALLSTLWDR